ncbi:transcriptional coactivator p15/PC4 family protein [Paraburkholderia jirisanensis]
MASPEASQTGLRADANTDTANDNRPGTLICEVQKNARERVRISVDQYKGHEYVNIRTWFVDAAGEYRPSKNGVTLKPSLIPQLLQGLELAARAADPTGAR